MKNIIHFQKPKEIEPKCSFCKRSKSEVSSLFQSEITSACICGDCVKHSKTRIEEESTND